ncbi:MAG: hypothetical protein ACRDAP_04470, partial [Shewanella sp.]
MHKHFLAIAITATLAGGLAVTGCSHNTSAPNAVTSQISNPLLAPSTLQYQAPDFSQIKDEHFKPALEQGI